MSASSTAMNAFGQSPIASVTYPGTIYPYAPTVSDFTYTWYPRLSDEDVDRIADRLIAKLEARGYRIDAMKSEEV